MSIITAGYQSPVHWRHLLSLEEELIQVARYVELAEENFDTYSIALSTLLLSAGSEVDVVAKQVCQNINRFSKASNIGHYGNQIASHYPAVEDFKVDVPRYNLRLHPWQNWSNRPRKSPYWWMAYNQVKHHRHTHFRQANLKNMLNAIAGLYVLVLYLYEDLAEAGKLSPNPVVLRPAEDFFNGTSVWDTEMLITYHLKLTWR